MSFSIWLQEKKKPKIGIDHQETDMMRNTSTSIPEKRIKSNFETWLEHKDDPIWFSTQPQPQPQQPTPTTNTSLTQREIERNTMAGVADPTADNYDPDFLSKSGYVSTRMQPKNSYFDVPTYDFYAGTAGDQDSGYSDTTYEFINGNTEISELTVGMHHNYYYMTDEEIAVYNYYHINDRNAGTNYAQRYLELIQEDLNRRAAKEEYAKYEGKPVAQMTYAAKSGIHNFGTAVDNWYRQEDGYIAPTATQLTSGLIKEELLDGKEITVGSVIYDVIETLSFMAPSALASTAATMIGGPMVGRIVGKTLSGAASGATTYQEKINEGYTQEQANTYGILLASTEIAIEFLLKGGTKLGGVAIKKVLPQIGKLDGILQKVAKSVGGKIVAEGMSEGIEETVQTFIAPYVAHFFMGKEITPDIEEALYSGLIGLLTGGLTKAGEITGVLPNIDNPDVNAEYKAEGNAFTDPDSKENTATNAEASIPDTTTDRLPEPPLKPQIPTENNETPSSKEAITDSTTPNPQAMPTKNTTDPLQLSQSQAAPGNTQQLLEKAVSQMHHKPMEPKLYNALFNYEQKLLQFKRTKNILADTRAKLTQQQASGASPIEIRQTQMDIAKLEKMIIQKENQMIIAENTPILKNAAEQQQNQLAALEHKQSQTTFQQQNSIQHAEIFEEYPENPIDISAKISKIKAEGNIITDGSHIQDGKLLPNVIYQTGEHAYYYVTNADGLICNVYVTQLERKKHTKRLPHSRKTPGKLPGDHAGHLIGDQFGGSGKIDNLVSQSAIVNQAQYRKIENQWSRAQKDGKKVTIEITIEHTPGNSRPASFVVRYTIGNTYFHEIIPNNQGG